DLARRAYDLLSRGARREVRVPMRRTLVALSNAVLSPIADRLSADRLLIVPDGPLQYVPFGTLPAHGGQSNPRDDEPLLAGHELVMLPSASVLGELRQSSRHRTRAAHTLAVLADPVLRPDDPRVRPPSPVPDNAGHRGPAASSSGSSPSTESDALVRSA